MQINRMKLLVIVLAVLLVVTVAYTVNDKMQQQYIVTLQSAYQEGYNEGVRGAVTSLFVQTNNCAPTVITIGNSTRQLIDTACLQLAEPATGG